MQSGMGMSAGVDEDDWEGGLIGDLDVSARGPVGMLPPRDEEVVIFPGWDTPLNNSARLEAMLRRNSLSTLIIVI